MKHFVYEVCERKLIMSEAENYANEFLCEYEANANAANKWKANE